MKYQGFPGEILEKGDIVLFLRKVLSMLKVVISGCRNYNNYKEAKEFLDDFFGKPEITGEITVISGACKGADMLGERYAAEMGYNIKRFPAEWTKYGRAAGPIRNEKMVDECDYLISFWDGKSKGTKDIIGCALKQGKPVKIKRVTVNSEFKL